jgi:putative endonuclease
LKSFGATSQSEVGPPTPDPKFVPSYGSARQLIFSSIFINNHLMGKSTYYYVYIIQSLKDTNRFYTGFSEDLDFRLKDHNQGKDPHTSKFKPWKIKTAIAFTDRNQALDFERYLKSPSGRAFAKKRL